jgi:hypothetical protein
MICFTKRLITPQQSTVNRSYSASYPVGTKDPLPSHDMKLKSQLHLMLRLRIYRAIPVFPYAFMVRHLIKDRGNITPFYLLCDIPQQQKELK